MPEYLSPGVYVEEIEIGGKPIEGVSTSTTGLLGEAERGPTKPTLITGFGQYQRIFGKHTWSDQKAESFLPHAVEGFFTNGGQRCYVARIIGAGSKTATTALGDGAFQISAVGPGAWGNRIGVRIIEASGKKKEQTVQDIFKLVVYYWIVPPPQSNIDPKDPNVVIEEFDNLSWDPNSSNYCVRAIHKVSHLIDLAEAEGANPSGGGAAASEGGGTSSRGTPAAKKRPRTQAPFQQ